MHGMTWLTVAVLVATAISPALGILEPSEGFPGYLVDHKAISFTPIPVPWGDESENRTLQISFIVRTLDTDGVLFTIDSINDEQFSLDLALHHSEFKLRVRIGHLFVGEYVDRTVVPDEMNIITTTLDFDNKIIKVNGITYDYEVGNIDRIDNSINVTFGNYELSKSCLNMEHITIGGNAAKLEPAIRKFHDCLFSESIVEAVEPESDDAVEAPVEIEEGNEPEPNSNLTDIVDTLNDPRIKDEDTAKKLENIEAQPELLNQPSQPVGGRPSCYSQQRTLCGPNSKGCLGTANIDNREADAPFQCQCREGYNGSRCQFSLLPRTCYEAFALNSAKVNVAGPYELDVDGSGPLLSSWALCEKNGTTVVTHNMPDNTIIRKAGNTTDNYFPISYRLFQDAQVRELIRQSASCQQRVTVDCNHSPLSFTTNSTWFVSASNSDGMIKQIGNTPDACECFSETESECAEARRCNCDSLQAGTDDGYLYGANAGITRVYALHTPYEEPESESKLTLGPLTCDGFSGAEQSNRITFTSEHGALMTLHHSPVTSLEFDFRTSREDIPSLVTFVDDVPITIGLSKGHLLNINIDKKPVWNVMSQPRLNDLRWHKIVIELIYEEIRISIDETHVFELFDVESLPSGINFGYEAEAGLGFIGCLRNIVINREPVAISTFRKSNENQFNPECPSLCYANKCEQNSRCIEHFETGTVSCECKNKYVHFGDRCEKNLNTDSEVSFHDRNIGFLEYPGNSLPANPVISTIVFSVRTDQRRALLLYAHDQSDNFVQVHLSDEYSIYLTLSNYTGDGKAEVLSCGVISNKFSEFSDMRWLQIIVERTPTRTTLSVDDEQCQILGPINPAPEDTRIKDYSSKYPEAIYPPMGQGQLEAPEPYQVLFIGGIRRPAIDDSFRKKRDRTVFYATLLPPLLGCMRGLVIGNSFVDMRKDGIRPANENAIRKGCYTDCETISCNNGGHCTYKWENRDPSMKEFTSCDCSKTSYTGSNCLKDIGVTFEGDAVLGYNFNKSHQYDLSFSPQQTIRFAFVPESLAIDGLGYRILSATFGQQNKLSVSITPLREGADRIDVVLRKPNVTLKFEGNFNDGNRHFFQASFNKRASPVFIVDAKKQYLEPTLPRISFLDVEKFEIGGQGPSDHFVNPDGSTEPIEHNYTGCISGLNIDFHQNRRTEFRPLELYLGEHPEGIFEIDPEIKLNAGNCAAFKVKGIIPTLQRDVQFPLWEAVFKPVGFTPNFTPSVNEDLGPEEGYPWWVYLLVILAILTLLFCCCLVLCCRNGKKNDKRDIPIGEGATPEKGSLLESPVDDFKVPPATAPLFDQKNGVDRPNIDDDNASSPASSLYKPSLPNSKENPDNDSLDTYAADDDDLDKVLSQGFGEERPNVMDRKTANMLEKTNPNRPASFAAPDLEAPPLPKKKLTPATVPKVD
uniref:EGF-like domain-containing protein n=1 Tax=Panagrellus redivivus TaxID=6233 RepID=A0A7E4WDY0_PANRE